MINLVSLLLCIVADQAFSVYSLKCLLDENCISELRHFTHADKFHVYKTLEEAQDACRSAEEAYKCVISAPKCKDPDDMARLSPILVGSRKLLKEFCGFKSKKRPCCALRRAYLSHSSCYLKIEARLSDCNDKYRRSLDNILNLEKKSEKEKMRYCVFVQFGDCVQRAAQSQCGKVAAQVIKSYMTKAGQHQKAFIQQNNECKELTYGLEDKSEEICESKPFQDCRVPSIRAKSKMSPMLMFTDLCSRIRKFSFGCLNAIYKRCLFSKGEGSGKFNEMLHGVDKEDEKDGCSLKNLNEDQDFYIPAHCLAENSPSFYKCNSEPENMTSNAGFTMMKYHHHFCSLTRNFENCLIETSNSTCGHVGARLMQNIVELTAVNNRWKCL